MDVIVLDYQQSLKLLEAKYDGDYDYLHNEVCIIHKSVIENDKLLEEFRISSLKAGFSDFEKIVDSLIPAPYAIDALRFLEKKLNTKIKIGIISEGNLENGFEPYVSVFKDDKELFICSIKDVIDRTLDYLLLLIVS